MKYSDLSLNQRIAIKGLIQSEGKTFPEVFSKKNADNTDLVLLKSIWMLSDFREAVNHFLKKYTQA